MLWDSSKVQVFELAIGSFSTFIVCQFRGETLRKVVLTAYGLVGGRDTENFWSELDEIFILLVVGLGV